MRVKMSSNGNVVFVEEIYSNNGTEISGSSVAVVHRRTMLIGTIASAAYCCELSAKADKFSSRRKSGPGKRRRRVRSWWCPVERYSPVSNTGSGKALLVTGVWLHTAQAWEGTKPSKLATMHHTYPFPKTRFCTLGKSCLRKSGGATATFAVFSIYVAILQNAKSL